MKRLPLLCAMVLLASCGSSDPTGPNAETATEFQYSFADAVGDTLPPTSAGFQNALDVKGLRVGMTQDSIFLRIEFTSAISAWSSHSANSIDGFIDFDFDDDPYTGFPAAAEEFAAVSAEMGVESYISLRDDGQGRMMRLDAASPNWRTNPVEFGTNSFTVRFSRADVGETDGVFRVSAMIGGTGRWITDLVPSAGHYRVN